MAWSTWRDHDCDGKGFSGRKIRKPDGLFRRNLRLDLTCSSAAGRSGGGAVSAELGRQAASLGVGRACRESLAACAFEFVSLANAVLSFLINENSFLFTSFVPVTGFSRL